MQAAARKVNTDAPVTHSPRKRVASGPHDLNDELLFFKAHMEASHFLLELSSGELAVRI